MGELLPKKAHHYFASFISCHSFVFCNCHLLQANLIIFYNEKRFCKCFHRSYYKHIQSNCSPLVNKLMVIEDDDFSERAIPIVVGLMVKSS